MHGDIKHIYQTELWLHTAVGELHPTISEQTFAIQTN